MKLFEYIKTQKRVQESFSSHLTTEKWLETFDKEFGLKVCRKKIMYHINNT